MKFSHQEKKDLLTAGAGLSLAFAILLGGGYETFFSYDLRFFLVFLIAFLTAGTGFLLHELMHKYVAQRYGLFAEFRASYNWVVLAIVFSFFGFIFAAPGAVFIRGHNITREKNGKISFAGPITNILLAVLFLLILLLSPKDSIISQIGSVGLSINSLLAAFNMIPLMPFDGAKIISWNKKIYYTTAIVAAGLFVLSWFL